MVRGKKKFRFEYRNWRNAPENFTVLPSIKYFFMWFLHAYSSLGKHLNLTSKDEWPGKLTFASFSVTDAKTPWCFFSTLTFCCFLLQHIYVPGKVLNDLSAFLICLLFRRDVIAENTSGVLLQGCDGWVTAVLRACFYSNPMYCRRRAGPNIIPTAAIFSKLFC